MARGEIAESIEAALRRDSLEAELRILQNRQSNLEIRSATDGVILAGSIDKRENYHVTVGQTLYKIAPVTELRVELAIPADQLAHVAEKKQVKFRFEDSQTIEGTIERIRPSSTILDNENVFIAEAALSNKDGNFHPGMQGTAKIDGGKSTLGWSLFHRPWENLVSAVGF